MSRYPNRFSGFPRETKTAKAVPKLFGWYDPRLKQGINEIVPRWSGVYNTAGHEVKSLLFKRANGRS